MTVAGPLAQAVGRWSETVPCAVLLLALSSLFLFSTDRGYFHRHHFVDWVSARAMGQAAGLSMLNGFAVQVTQTKRGKDGAISRNTYQRYPVAAYAIVGLAIAPFEHSLAAQIQAARLVMLAFLAAAAVLAYCALARLTGSRWIAVGATLLAFSSYRVLNTGPMVSNEGSVGLCAVLLVFHGMVVFAQGGRFWPLLVKTCVALLFSWHVYGLLLAFVAIGFARDLVRAWRRPAGGPTPARAARAVGRALRGRPFLLGFLALLFGSGVLAYNFAGEVAAMPGETMFADLPLAGSIERRLGTDAGFRADKEWFLAWPTFLKLQLHRIGGLILPYATPALPTIWNDQPAARVPAGSVLVWVGALALVASALWVFLAPGHRALWATLVLSGYGWSLPMRHMTADPEHTFETVFWLGIPLAVFAALLWGVRARWRTWGRPSGLVWGGPACAAAALAVFVASNARMGGADRDGVFAQRQHAVMTEFDAIRHRVRGQEVLVAIHHDAQLPLGEQRYAFRYYLHGSVLQYDDSPQASERQVDFVLSRQRVPSESLLTPEHRHVYLYDSVAAVDEITDAHRRQYDALTTAPPTMRGAFDIHLRERHIFYVKETCPETATEGRFFLHVVPLSARDLSPAALRLGFANLDFWFGEHGVRFDGKCLAAVPLPRFGVAAVRTGRLATGTGPVVWRTDFHTPAGLQALRDWRENPGRPMAHSVFNIGWASEARTLTFVRNPCAPEDVEARFILHLFPANRADLPAGRRDAGFDNFDFHFDERGAMLDGACVAAVPLPEYELANARAGQWAAGGQLWQVKFEFVPLGRDGESGTSG